MIASERPDFAAPETSTFHGTDVVNRTPAGAGEVRGAEPESDADVGGLEWQPATRMTEHKIASTVAGRAGYIS